MECEIIPLRRIVTSGITVILLILMALAGSACTERDSTNEDNWQPSADELEEYLNEANYPYYAQLSPESIGIVEVRYKWWIETHRLGVRFLVKNLSGSEILGLDYQVVCKDADGEQLYPPSDYSGIPGMGFGQPIQPGKSDWGGTYIDESDYYGSSNGRPLGDISTVEVIIVTVGLR